MMVSEEQARKTRCCGPEGCGGIGLDGSRWCIASDCMAWEPYKSQITHNPPGDCGLKLRQPREAQP